MFILYASFLDYFFGTDLGFFLDRLGFCFEWLFLHHIPCGRSVISFLASFHSLLGQFGLLYILGGFMSDAFLRFFFYGRVIFSFFFLLLFVLPFTPLMIKRLGREG